MIDQALEKTEQFLGEHVASAYVSYYRRLQTMSGAERIFKRITESTHEEKVLDYLAEVHYALAFAGLGFDVVIEPYGNKGADFLIKRESNWITVEVTRFRKVHPGPPMLDVSKGIGVLPEYGNIKRDIRKAIRKIYKKFSQIGEEKAFIAIWNDDEDMEEVEVEEAVRDLQRDDSLPEDLLFILYGSKWVGPARTGLGTNQQFYCYPFHPLIEREYRVLQIELESHTLYDLMFRALE